jgi:hypothetical protein
MPSRSNPELSPRELAALAAGCLMIDDARLYGLVSGGPKVDREHCEAVLERLGREGVVPTKAEAQQAALDLIAESI